MSYFEEVKKNFEFGCMRLPMKDGEVDHEEFSRMVDYFIDAGFNYFDTAHGYLGGKSEKALRKCLVDRYPREKYILTDKLTASFFKTEADVRPFFESQLDICGVDYFDFYLMHAQNHDNFVKFKECRAYEQALEFKKEGKIHHFGISFHDTADVLCSTRYLPNILRSNSFRYSSTTLILTTPRSSRAAAMRSAASTASP